MSLRTAGKGVLLQPTFFSSIGSSYCNNILIIMFFYLIVTSFIEVVGDGLDHSVKSWVLVL